MVSLIACKEKVARSENKPYIQEITTKTEISETVLLFMMTHYDYDYFNFYKLISNSL